VLFRDLAGASVQSVLAVPDDSLASPAGVVFSADSHQLFVASASARSVLALNLDTGARSTFACNCAPAGLVAMGNMLRLNELEADPLWLFDYAADQPRIVFVPALPAASAN
jgi:hypothetical protein